MEERGDTFYKDDIEIDFDDTGFFGLGAGYHFSESLAVQAEILYANPKIVAQQGTTPSQRDHADLFFGSVNLVYDVMHIDLGTGQLVPQLSGGLGFMHVNGGPHNVDFDGTELAYNAGAGVRWDVKDWLFVSAIYRGIWTKLEPTDENICMDGFTFSVGLVF